MNQTVLRDRFWLRIIYSVSAVICLVVALLILGPRPFANRLDVSALPLVNASLNAATALALIFGFYQIKQRNILLHQRAMFFAFGTSSAFLVSYVLYHSFKSAPKVYAGDFRGLYLTILLTHIVLAAVILPLALITLYRGYNTQLPQHRRLAKITFPLWLYVSITGIVIYWMLYG